MIVSHEADFSPMFNFGKSSFFLNRLSTIEKTYYKSIFEF